MLPMYKLASIVSDEKFVLRAISVSANAVRSQMSRNNAEKQNRPVDIGVMTMRHSACRYTEL